MGVLSGLFSKQQRTDSDHKQYASDLLKSLLLMAWFVEARDPYTGGHLWRVSRYAYLMAQTAGLGREQCARSALGGFLHDLGKIGIPDNILKKEGPLNEEEYAIIRTHPAQGLRLVANHPLSGLVSDAILMHHERPDGKGYPQGINANEIPQIAKIVGVADAFDAMTSQRPYRVPMAINNALGIIREGRGTQFDPYWADALIELNDGVVLEHIQGHSDEGIPLYECPMCGPTLVVMRRQEPGEPIYCQSCKGEFVIEQSDDRVSVRATGNKGNARDLEPQADEALIDQLLRDTVKRVPVEKWMAAYG